MFLIWNRITRRWEVPFAHHENEGAGEGDGGGSGSSDKAPADDAAALKAENARLKKQIDEVGPRVKAMEDAERRRVDEAAKRDEDKRKKEVGADVLLKEKDDALKSVRERLESFEKRERERVDAAFENLPEELREAIAPLKDSLPVDQWSAQVERLIKVSADKKTDDKEEPAMGMFFKPGGGEGGGKQKLNPMAAKILDEMGRDPDDIAKRIVVNRMKDEETGRTTSRFTRHVRDFFKSMNLAPVHKIDVKR